MNNALHGGKEGMVPNGITGAQVKAEMEILLCFRRDVVVRGDSPWKIFSKSETNRPQVSNRNNQSANVKFVR
jgi:hypothetical protein